MIMTQILKTMTRLIKTIVLSLKAVRKNGVKITIKSLLTPVPRIVDLHYV